MIKVRATCTGRGGDMKVNGRLSNQGRFDAQLDNCYFAWLGAPRAGSLGHQRAKTEPMGAR